jgi:hypothetical protein
MSVALALAFALAGCGSNGLLKTDTPSTEQRLLELERRMDRMEARFSVAPPYRNKAEIQAHIKELEAERAELLTRYLPQHPAIKDIDRMLWILDKQLKELE